MRLAHNLATLLALLLWIGSGEPATANPWDRLRALGATDGAAATATMEDIARDVMQRPNDGKTPLVAQATEVGHWRLANRAGEQFTAAGADELAQALRTLAPGAEKDLQQLHIYLTPDSLFLYPRSLAELPVKAALSVFIRGRPWPILRSMRSGGAKYLVGAAQGLYIEAGDQASFEELARQLQRPLHRARVRTLALEPGGQTQAAATPDIDPGTRRARPDAVDPGHAGKAFAHLGGHIVLVTGSLSGDRLSYKPGSGASGSIALAELWQAAAEADANVIVLGTSSARQPGTRNWLWQRMGLAAADKALGAATLGEFLHVLAGGAQELVVRADRMLNDRIEVSITSLDASDDSGSANRGATISGAVKGTWSDIVSETAGSLTIVGMKASLTRSARQAELDRRILPFLPSVIQYGYLALMAAGLLVPRTLARWWRHIWPAESVAEYGTATALLLAQSARGLAFGLIFVPLAALPAVVTALVKAATSLTGWRRHAPGGNLSTG